MIYAKISRDNNLKLENNSKSSDHISLRLMRRCRRKTIAFTKAGSGMVGPCLIFQKPINRSIRCVQRLVSGGNLQLNDICMYEWTPNRLCVSASSDSRPPLYPTHHLLRRYVRPGQGISLVPDLRVVIFLGYQAVHLLILRLRRNNCKSFKPPQGVTTGDQPPKQNPCPVGQR